MDPLPPLDSAAPHLRAAKRRTLVFLLFAMALMGVAGLGIALATMNFRRSRDIPATLVAEGALLDKLPGICHQVVVCKPGWAEFGPLVSQIPPAGRMGTGEKKPVQWAGGSALPGESPFLVADWPENLGVRTAPAGWHLTETLWVDGEPPSGKTGLPAGLNLMVRGRVGQNPDQVRVWVAGMDIPWSKGWGQQLWKAHPHFSTGSDLKEALAGVKNWVTWIERQPDRVILRAELECPENRDAKALEKVLEKQQSDHPEQWASFRFLADGPWVSLQAHLVR